MASEDALFRVLAATAERFLELRQRAGEAVLVGEICEQTLAEFRPIIDFKELEARLCERIGAHLRALISRASST
jgi:hypothetical protein